MNLFTKAIVRKPCRALIDGITTGMFDSRKPSYEDAVKQHEQYVGLLKKVGLEVLVLDELEEYPDSCFVEDPAVVMKECAVICNPATESRNGEKHEIIDAIRKYYDDSSIFYIESPGTLEGGDILQIDKHFYVGRSDRTNDEGFSQFSEIVSHFGYKATQVPVTEGLHLKDFAIYLDNGNMLVSKEMNKAEAFKSYNKYVVDPDELYSINSLYINGTVLVPKGNPKTLEYIKGLGYPTQEVDTAEFKKIDGSLTCLSLRF